MVNSSNISGSAAVPITIPTKSTAAEPKLNDTMEMGTVQADAPASPQQQQQEDIMQLARVGDTSGMEKLFETGDFDATYTDNEGITPLHVRVPILLSLSESARLTASSGQPLTTSMRCASSSSSTAPKSTRKEANQ